MEASVDAELAGKNERSPSVVENCTTKKVKLRDKGEDSLEMDTNVSSKSAFSIGSAFVVTDYEERFPKLQFVDILLDTKSAACKTNGAESLPKGIAVITSDLEMRPLWNYHKKSSKLVINLLAMAVGILQKQNVNKIVKKGSELL